LDQTTPPTLACHNCKTLVTDAGQQVWVCERCGKENQVPVLDETEAQAAINEAAAKTVVPPTMPSPPPIKPMEDLPV